MSAYLGGFEEYRINVFSVFIIGWNMCCNFSLSKMLQNYSFTYPKKKKNGGREEALGGLHPGRARGAAVTSAGSWPVLDVCLPRPSSSRSSPGAGLHTPACGETLPKGSDG